MIANYIITNILFIGFWSSVCIYCMSLDSIKDYHQNFSSGDDFALEIFFKGHYSQSPNIAKGLESIQAEEQFLADPCFQHQMHIDATLWANVTIQK